MPRLLIGLLLCCLATPGARAWWDTGHMVVAEIAYGRLTPAAREKVDALIATPIEPASPRSTTFVSAACWADDHKRELKTGPWHYIDIPLSLDGASLTTATHELETTPFDVVKAIRLDVAMLQSTTATAQVQAEHLRYLIHFVGDIHQPCHCAAAVWEGLPKGDAGGNAFALVGTWTKLHMLWDSAGGMGGKTPERPLDGAGMQLIAELARVATSSLPYEELAKQQPAAGTALPDPMRWAEEGAELAKSTVYAGLERGAAPSPEYLCAVQTACRHQWAKAGYRLADLLNQIYGK